jgi:aminoglycoside 3-N-acetyltransferase
VTDVSERDVIDRTPAPATESTLRADLAALGVGLGDTLVVHTSLSAMGFVIGGPQTVVTAFLQSVGAEGTVTMPSHSGDWSDPAEWENPPVPEAWWPTIRAEWPGFDPHLTPLRAMGAVAEALHRHPHTSRSDHPRVSHLANGAAASAIVASHALGSGLGDESPLGRLYDLDATVLLVGVGHANNTSLHLAEARADWPGKTTSRLGSAVLVDGERRWVEYDELDIDTDDFGAAGHDFERRTGLVRRGRIGMAPTAAMPMRALVDHGTRWFTANRGT